METVISSKLQKNSANSEIPSEIFRDKQSNMQNFRTENTPDKPGFTLNHRDGIVMMGSCFSENIGEIMRRYQFDVDLHSHGIIFNPLAISQALNDVINKKMYNETNLVCYNGFYHSLFHHGNFSSNNPRETLDRINARINESHEKLRNAKVLMITFGSAWAYFYKKTNSVVANCHKIPQQEFEKRLLSHAEVERSMQDVFDSLKKFNPNLKVIFTISPVRHLRDGFFENQLSKSNLFVAISNLLAMNENYFYFPAYEIELDDLRDYRFFKEDLVHPNSTAINYVWEKFISWVLDSATQNLLQKMEPILKFLDHRPMKISESQHEEIRTKKMEELNLLILDFMNNQR